MGLLDGLLGQVLGVERGAPGGIGLNMVAGALFDSLGRPRATTRGGFAAVVALCAAMTLAASEASAARTLSFVPGPSGVIVEPSIPLPPKFNGFAIAGPSVWAAADLRGDGRKDLVVGFLAYPNQPTAFASPLRILRPKADGTGFADVTRALLGNGPLPSTENSKQILVADFNGDGRDDVFVAAHGYDAPPFAGDRNPLMLSNGDGTFTDASPGLPLQRDFSHSATVGDVNGDGLLDIYVGNVCCGAYPPYFLIGQPGGRFEQVFSTLPVEVVQWQGAFRFYASLLADIDGDGHLDLVLGSGYAGETPTPQTVVYYNDGSGDFTKRPRTQFLFGPFGATATVLDIVAFDVNDDGRMDLLVLTTQGGARSDLGMAIQVLVNQGNGRFTDESFARLGASASRTDGRYYAFIRFADLDGDGRLDFFGYGPPGLDVPFAWLNNGDGTFTPVVGRAVFERERIAIEAIDVDGDGRLDFVEAWFDANGHVTYTTWLNRTPRTAPGEPVSVYPLSGDGRVALAFKPPLGNGPQPLTGYTATCRSPAGVLRSVASVTSPVVVDGLVNGTRYACTVRAQMGSVSGPPSKPVPAQPRAGLHTVLEFHNSALDHYFITANFEEQVAVAGGAAGAEWWLTGQRFRAGGAAQVCRFYGSVSPGPNSHFYTIDPSECDLLKALQAQTPANQKRWNFEGNDFTSTPPARGACAAGTVPVLRAYNDGFAKGVDSNHRIVANPHLHARQLAGGWKDEGVVMCSPE